MSVQGQTQHEEEELLPTLTTTLSSQPLMCRSSLEKERLMIDNNYNNALNAFVIFKQSSSLSL